MNKDVIVALDMPYDPDPDNDFISRFPRGSGLWIKIGPVPLLERGVTFIEEAKNWGCNIMLDLKFHDIPNTVEKACKEAAGLGVDMLTVHLSGGRKMIDAALNGVTGSPTKILGISVLTSLDAELLSEIGFKHADMPSIIVDRLVDLGIECGVHGIVCSGAETKEMRQKDEDLIIVNPGIRFPSEDASDQKRVVTPQDAAADGASFIVVGRSIYQADDPVSAYSRFREAFCDN